MDREEIEGMGGKKVTDKVKGFIGIMVVFCFVDFVYIFQGGSVFSLECIGVGKGVFI